MSGMSEQIGDRESDVFEARDRADFEAATRRIMVTKVAEKLPWLRCTRVVMDHESGRIVEAEFSQSPFLVESVVQT
jgi:hypothetical protein